MNTNRALELIASVDVKKVEVKLSLSGVSVKSPLIECLWPRITFECQGRQRVEPFTYWRELSQIQPARAKALQLRPAGTNVIPPPIANRHTLEEVVFLAAGLRPMKRPILLADAAEMKAKKIHQHVQLKLAQATMKASFRKRHQTLMRRLERIVGKTKLRELIVSLPIRLEKRDVVEAWHEAIVYKVMES